MYLHSKIFVSAENRVTDIIKENPLMMLVIENFGIYDIKKEQTVAQLC